MQMQNVRAGVVIVAVAILGFVGCGRQDSPPERRTSTDSNSRKVSAASAKLSGTYKHVSDDESFIKFLDGGRFETEKRSSKYRIEGDQITFEIPSGEIQRGKVKGDTVNVEHRESGWIVWEGEYRRQP